MLGSFEHSLSKTSRPVDDPRRRAVCHFGGPRGAGLFGWGGAAWTDSKCPSP